MKISAENRNIIFPLQNEVWEAAGYWASDSHTSYKFSSSSRMAAFSVVRRVHSSTSV